MNTPPAGQATLGAWLDAQLAAHTSEIELGLDRVGHVADALGLRCPAQQSVLIGGTNGKGSCVALIAGLIGSRARVGCYTSPHLWRYNERVTIDGTPASDADFIAAFTAIEAVRGETRLTFFEWGTLAALWLFKRAGVDIAILEVGLGGRLDAVNIVDADIALVVSIGLDHTDWLGETREAIGYEKAGIYRADKPALCSERDRPASLAAQAATVGACFQPIGEAFDIRREGRQWWVRDGQQTVQAAVEADVLDDNMAAGVAVVHRLGLSLSAADIARGAHAQRRLPGRREWHMSSPAIVYDVGHNEAAIARLIETLTDRVFDRVHLVIGMLADKPIETIGAMLAPHVDHWYPVDLSSVTPRGASAAQLCSRLGRDNGQVGFASPAAGLAAARSVADACDCIVVCGSFYTVAQVRDPMT